MRLHLFNPENDLALAAGIERYTPPAAAVRLSRAGQLLPAWLAGSGDAILVTDERAAEEADRLNVRFGLGIRAVTEAPADVVACSPWGWSRAARRRLIDAGVSLAKLPSDGWLDTHRCLSSRLSTVELSNALGIEPPVVARTPGEAVAAVAANEASGLASFMKMPWSSSGRGVFPTARMNPAMVERRAADIIRSQSAVIIEPDRHRRSDFAALYYCKGGCARFMALSLFATDERGGYRGNIVTSDDDIISRLGADPMPWAAKVADALTAVVAPHYSGWAGVDMVVTERGGIWPLIELNLRSTMGVVAAAMRPYFGHPVLLAPSPDRTDSHLPLPYEKQSGRPGRGAP